jgi:hypothetical protein
VSWSPGPRLWLEQRVRLNVEHRVMGSRCRKHHMSRCCWADRRSLLKSLHLQQAQAPLRLSST